MGVQSDFFVSDPGDANRYDGVSDWPSDDRAQWKGVTSLELSMLWAELKGSPWDVPLMDSFENVSTIEGGERVTDMIPAPLVELLANQSDSALESLAQKWGSNEEFEGWSQAEVHEVLASIVQLARRAMNSGRYLYVWNSL